MPQIKLAKTPWHSFCAIGMSKGCQLCVKGRKLVLFVTGLCGQRCFYCPVSELKSGKDVVYANEWKIANPDNPVELIEEAKLTEAKGAGITGGDPLVKIDRCVDYIKLLKKKFGKQFHIHLYTPLKLVTEERLKKLYDAGLDEIRFHPNLDDNSLWPQLELARKYSWDIGVEIPVIPGYEERTKALIDYLAGKIMFLNLNELELSDTQIEQYKLQVMGFKPKDDVSYGAAGSEELGLRLAKYAGSKGIKTHFCTAKLKDSVQMRKRIQFRAKHAALPFDLQTEEGTLVRGCAYLKELAPGVGYQKKIQEADKDVIISKLEEVRKQAIVLLQEKADNVVVDKNRLRLILPQKKIKSYAPKLKQLGLAVAIVEEYPTADALEVEVEFL
jgi:pyruvate formate-lyase activating enzyme-like uncharacterized protein